MGRPSGIRVAACSAAALAALCAAVALPLNPSAASPMQTDGRVGPAAPAGPAPTLASVAPNIGPIVGGTRVTVTGTNFSLVGTVRVNIGGKQCGGVVVVDPTTLTCTTGARRTGAVDVVLTNPDRQRATATRGFTYVARLAAANTYWTDQFGTVTNEIPTAIEAGPGGDLWVYGRTNASLPGSSRDGGRIDYDTFLARYSKTGERRWVMEFGSINDDKSAQRLIVLPNGDAIVTGQTNGVLPGNSRDGGRHDYDGFVARVSKTGTLVWAKQWGGTDAEYPSSIAKGPSGSYYVIGETDGVTPSNTSTPNASAGGEDSFVARLDSDGNMVWTTQFGGPSDEYPWDIAVAKSGAVYAVGSTTGDLDGPTGTLCAPSGCASAGKDDGFLVRLTSAGAIVWARQFGGSEYDEFYGVAAGPTGDVYTAGYSEGDLGTPGTNSVNPAGYDGVVQRWTSDGTLRWSNQHGTDGQEDQWYIEVAPNGDAFVAGFTSGEFPGYSNLGSWDAYVLRVAANGATTNVHQLSTYADDSNGTYGPAIALTGSQGVALATPTKGTMWGQLAHDSAYDLSLTLLARPGSTTTPSDKRWTSQFGGTGNEHVAASASDAKGNVYVYGSTDGSVEPGRPNAGTGEDVFVAKYDTAGNLLWIRQFGTDAYDTPTPQMVVRANGDVFVAGYSQGVYGLQTKPGGPGNDDAFIAKINTNGAIKWFKQWGNSASEEPLGITAAANGDLYLSVEVAGGAAPSGSLPLNNAVGSWDSAVARFDRNGNFKWAHQFGAESQDLAQNIAVTKQGYIYIVGNTQGSIGSTLITPGALSAGYIAKYDKDGHQLWVKLYGGATAQNTYLVGVTATPDGSIIASGYTTAVIATPYGGYDGVAFRVEANGDVRWVKQFGSTNLDFAQAGVLTKNGWYYVGGMTQGAVLPFGFAGANDAFVIGISPDATSITVRQFGTEGNESGYWQTPGLALRPDGKLVIATESNVAPWGGATPSNSDLIVTAFSPPSDAASAPIPT